MTAQPLPAAAEGNTGPIGLGFRVPGLVISPYSRGGLVASETFDHTSQLRLIEKRFGVRVPNLTAWRRSVTGDMTSTFNFVATPDAQPATLPDAGAKATDALLQCKAGVDTIAGTFFGKLDLVSYPVPPSNSMPRQERAPVRGRPSGPVTAKPTPKPTPAPTPAPTTPRRAAPVPITAPGGQPRTRVAAAVDAAQRTTGAVRTTDTGSNTQFELLAGAALIGTGAVLAASANQPALRPAAETEDPGPTPS